MNFSFQLLFSGQKWPRNWFSSCSLVRLPSAGLGQLGGGPRLLVCARFDPAQLCSARPISARHKHTIGPAWIFLPIHPHPALPSVRPAHPSHLCANLGRQPELKPFYRPITNFLNHFVTRIYACITVYAYTHMWLWIYTYLYLQIYVCIYIYIYIYIYDIYIYIYIFILLFYRNWNLFALSCLYLLIICLFV